MRYRFVCLASFVWHIWAMRRNHFVLVVALLFLTCVGGGLSPAPALAQSAEIAIESAAYPPNLKFSLGAEAPAALKSRTSKDDVVNRVVLPPPVADKRQVTPAPKGAPQQIGFARTIPPDDAQQVAAAHLRWTSVGSGTVAAFSITSTGATALRVSLAFQSLPHGAEIRFFSLGPDERVFGPFTLTDIRSLEAKEGVGGAGLFWSPVIEGDTAGVEIFVPAVMQTGNVRFTLGDVSHLVASAMHGGAFQDKSSGWCEINVACYSSTWGSTAKAVAKIIFTSGGSSYLCTGTLLNDADPSTYKPFFLTANHCISTSSAAATVNSWWLYQSTCGGTSASPRQLYRGAALLATSSSNDFSFLLLNEPAPSDVTFAGWTTADPISGAAATGVHHPAGDVKKISFGTVDGISSFGDYVAGFGSYLYTTWYQGVTEGGSSGSPLFNAAQQVVGQLKGGYSSCAYPADPDYYGRFSLTFPYVRAWVYAPVVSLRTDVPFPATAGASVTWTATGAGGTSPYTYQFWLFDGAAWSMVRDWNSSNTWMWQPATPGSYAVQVWLRNAGSGALYDAFGQGVASVSPRPALTVTSVTPGLAGGGAGQPVTWSANATYGAQPYTFQFWVFDGAQWRLGQDWSPSSTWTWTPSAPGTYSFQVWVRNAGSSARLDAFRSFGPYVATGPPALSVQSLSADRAAPVPAGTPIIWTTLASGGTGPYTYQFWVFNGTTWNIGQDWSVSPTWTWVPAAPATYMFQAWVRNAGSAATYDAYRSAGPFTISSAAPLAVTAFAITSALPVHTGAPAIVSAAAAGGNGPYTYQFWVFNGSSWSIGQSWSASNKFTWTPSAPGPYSMQVWVRNTGSGNAWDAYRSLGSISVMP